MNLTLVTSGVVDQSSVAYQVGRYAGTAVLVALGVLLLRKGLRARRSSAVPQAGIPAPVVHDAFAWMQPAVPAPTVPTATATATANDPNAWAFTVPAVPVTPAPPRTPSASAGSRSGTATILPGCLVLLAAAVQAASASTHRPHRTVDAVSTNVSSSLTSRSVALPPSLLGLPLNVSLTSAFQQGGATFPPMTAVYGTSGHTVTVLAGSGALGNADTRIREFRTGGEAELHQRLGAGSAVDPGPLGGKARCWLTTTSAGRVGACIFVDSGSVVETYDEGVATAAEAGRRARAIHDLIVRAR